jgi:hypothetical protein
MGALLRRSVDKFRAAHPERRVDADIADELGHDHDRERAGRGTRARPPPGYGAAVIVSRVKSHTAAMRGTCRSAR